MQFRIGINIGDVIEEGQRIYGDGVNIAARLESLADPGGICISKTAFDHIESKLPLGYEFIGEQQVKNIAKPVSAYKVLMDPRVIAPGRSTEKRALPPWTKKALLAAGVTIVTIVIALSIWNYYIGGRLTKPAPGGENSIVVLPFTNLSNDPELESFSDGITEELINTLAKVKRLKVSSRTSAFSYKGKDVDLRTVGRELRVDHVLEGSVRKSGNTLRITAQLVNVADDAHLWSEIYDREMKDVFVIQGEVATAVAQNVKTQLLGIEAESPPGDLVRRFGVDTIVKEGEVIEDGLSAFGANIEIDGTVKGGLETFGANISVSGQNMGDLKFAGANVVLSGRFSDKVGGAAANLIIAGIFEEDVEVTAARIIVMPSAVIKGDLAYATALFERKEGSQIHGKVVQLMTEEGEKWSKSKRPAAKEGSFLATAIFWFISTIALIITGLLVNYFLPRQTEKIVATLSGSIWRNFGVGLLLLIATPLFIAISFFTAIGIPIGILTAFVYIATIYLNRVYVGLWIGRKIIGLFDDSLATFFFWPVTAGIILVGLLVLIPVIGWFLRFFLLFIGLGAIVRVIWTSARSEP
jgi:TolB-like protein/cytoskeletal protein CcmA (bactofilin family)